MNDTASLIEVGAALWLIRSWVQRQRGGAEPTVSEPNTLAALAAAGVDEATQRLIVGCQYEKTVPLTVSLEHWAGTDERDVWAVCFSHAEGYVALIFVSPSGFVLGTATVPARFGFQEGVFRERTASEISEWDGPSPTG